jgi:protein tyrosine/serine phosphatase
MENRVLALSGIHNFRDYGGYAARAGRLRSGTLWRSGQHCGASPQDLEAVNRLGISTVIDLRGDSERAAFPCLRHDEFAGEVLFHPGETAGSHGRAAHEEFAAGIATAEDARTAMLRLYDTLPFRPVLARTFALYLQALAQRDAPSLLHCLAGKDRTGLAAALVHALMGVHHDDMMADYLLTNTAGNSEARIAAGAASVRSGFGPAMDDGAVRMIMSVQPEFLDNAFAAIRAAHGTVEAYAAAVLGADQDTVQRIETNLVI